MLFRLRVALMTVTALPALAPMVSAATHDDPIGAAVAFLPPASRTLDSLRSVIRPRHWLYVTTTGDGRLRLRVDHVGEHGLLGLHGYQAPPPVDVLEWRDVSMIELRRSRADAGRVCGALVGAIALGSIGWIVRDRYTIGRDTAPLLGVGAGVLLGGQIGAKLGDVSHETIPLHVAVPDPDRDPNLMDRMARGRPGPGPGPHVDLAVIDKSTKPTDVLRVHGEFGTLAGRVTRIDIHGLHGFEREPRFDRESGAIPDQIPWSTIDGLERRGKSAAAGALALGVVGGLACGTLAAYWSAAASHLTRDREMAGSEFALGLAVGGASGALIGALVGSRIGRWHRVRGFTRAPSTQAPGT